MLTYIYTHDDVKLMFDIKRSCDEGTVRRDVVIFLSCVCRFAVHNEDKT